MAESKIQEEYICDSCGFTTLIPNDTCLQCGAPLDTPGPKDGALKDDETELDATLTDAEIAAGEDEGLPLSLEALKEEEGEEDQAEYEQDSYGSE